MLILQNDHLLKLSFWVIRLRKDVKMKYPYVHPRVKRKGRPTKFSGNVAVNRLDMQYFSPCIKEDVS